jgi:hypothetical protein
MGSEVRTITTNNGEKVCETSGIARKKRDTPTSSGLGAKNEPELAADGEEMLCNDPLLLHLENWEFAGVKPNGLLSVGLRSDSRSLSRSFCAPLLIVVTIALETTRFF